MNTCFVCLLLAFTLTQIPARAQMAGLGLGVEKANFDPSVRPQDDFYRFVNGTWLKITEIPADKSNYGAFSQLADQAEKDIRTILEEAAARRDKKVGSDEQKIGDLYLSFMDSAKVEALGIEPIRNELAEIDQISNYDDLVNYFGKSGRAGVGDPVAMFVEQDEKKSTEYIVYFGQSGLSLPDREYYFGDQFKDARDSFVRYVQKMYGLAGWQDGEKASATIFDLETRIASKHWTRVQNRDRDASYNKLTAADRKQLMPRFNWARYFEGAGLKNVNEVIVNQPSYFRALDSLVVETPIEDWKTYLRFSLLDSAAPFLSGPFVNANFDFYQRSLSGVEEMAPRWKRAIETVNGALGEMVGRVYVERHFPPEAKARMDEMIKNLRTAYKQGIDDLEWMSPETKAAAQAKLAKFAEKIGYPRKWRDYSALSIRKDDLFGNIVRARDTGYQRMIDKLGKPIDRDEWLMTPQTVNAYYNPVMNEIAFPAAILQPPFFNVEADDAVNYGAIGGVIGHEISHGFDDQGAKSDGDGNLRDWWTENDKTEFVKRSKALVDQYSAFSPIDGMNLNGELTLGENIADLSGLTMAYKAYKLSLKDKEAPVIDGFTGDQRFFLGWAQVWRRKYRDDELKQRLITDPHSPSEYRANVPLSNMPEFYTAFDVKEGDKLYRAPEQRVKIW